MKKTLLLLTISSICFASSIEDTYSKANKLENEKKYKEANTLYKQLLKNVDKNIYNKKYIIDKAKNENHEVQIFTNMKKKFYTDILNKTEDKETNNTLEQMITGNFGLYPYRKNYILPITYDIKEQQDRNQFETKFQFSIEKPVSYNFFKLNESISVAYTQKSFWQTNKDSSPFRETNYKPEIFIQFPYKNSQRLKGYKLSLIHESNGREGIYSRSWNRLYLESYFQLTSTFIIPRIWYRIPEKAADDDNPDILDYYGYGDITILYPYKQHSFEIKLRNNLRLKSKNKGAITLNWAFPLPEFLSTQNSYGFLQIFSGYGESLIDYNKELHKIGFGIAFSR